MDKHAIPQNIMDVEFKLFGSLTIRQFFSLSGGILIAVIIYFLGLPWIVGWPLMGISLIIGFSLTFITINGQPFSKWFSNYIRAMFSSQRYVWKKQPKTPKVLKPSSGKKPSGEKPAKKTKKEFGTLPILEAVNKESMKIDASEYEELKRLDKYFNAEFGKTFSKEYDVEPVSSVQPKRVVETREGIAGETNPIGRGQQKVKTGDNSSFVYSNTQNRKTRPLGFSSEEDRIEKKVREILQMQQELNPYMKTKEIEEKEKRLKDEMRKLYKEVQDIKKNK
ncbi:hypothetical protein GF389_01760 [Candidatus Dojkabacteria bacterium]|nr:hypothetical protein [Candidatus Dojkabacteria bacterium]